MDIKQQPVHRFRLSKKFSDILEKEEQKKPKVRRLSIGRIAKCMLLGYMIDKKLIAFSDVDVLNEIMVEGVQQALDFVGDNKDAQK